MRSKSEPRASEAPALTFASAVCGVDGSPESIEAARQASRIVDPAASILLVTAVDPLPSIWDAPPYGALETVGRVQAETEGRLAATQAAIGPRDALEARMVEGRPIDVLLSLTADADDCLLAVGAKRTVRIAGILLGHIVTELAHRASCSVLVGREPPDRQRFPRSIVAGIDGSPGSAAAFAAASAIARRQGATLHPLVALGGGHVDLPEARRIAGELELAVDERPPVEALTSGSDDLIVVGSRGLHRLAALGSVGERVAHRATRSVLIVKST